MFLQRKDNGFEMTWGGGLEYGKIRHQDEVELSRYAFNVADVEMLRRHFEDWEREAGRCLEQDEPLVIPALEAALKMSHLFNLMDARGAVAVTERVALIGRVRKIAVRCARAYVEQRERLAFPLGRCNGNGKPNGKAAGREPDERERRRPMSAAEFLLELLCEEIPANALPAAREQLRAGFEAELRDAALAEATVRTYSTVRRLVVHVAGLPEAQPDREEEVTGPSVKAAFAADGSPTPAAVGFAKGQGVSVDALRVVKGAKGEVIAATKLLPGRPVPEVLAEISVRVVRALHFPKTMRWGKGEHVFVRPLHNLLAVFGKPNLHRRRCRSSCSGWLPRPARSATGRWPRRASSSRARPGSPPTSSGCAPRAWTSTPTARNVVLEGKARRLAAEVGCEIRPDPELLAELVELVEHPGVLRGEIAERFLELPEEVLVTTLRHHQKCLVLTREGRVAPYFLAVCDRSGDPQGLIQRGNEWVAGARLTDAAFFFDAGPQGPARVAPAGAREGARPPEARHVRAQDGVGRQARGGARRERRRRGGRRGACARLRAAEGRPVDRDGRGVRGAAGRHRRDLRAPRRRARGGVAGGLRPVHAGRARGRAAPRPGGGDRGRRRPAGLARRSVRRRGDPIREQGPVRAPARRPGGGADLRGGAARVRPARRGGRRPWRCAAGARRPWRRCASS